MSAALKSGRSGSVLLGHHILLYKLATEHRLVTRYSTLRLRKMGSRPLLGLILTALSLLLRVTDGQGEVILSIM